jgi:hypothetical protein
MPQADKIDVFEAESRQFRHVSAFDLREIRDLMNSVAHSGEEIEPGFALGGIGIIDRDLVEKCVHRRAEAGERRHRAFEILRLHRGAGARLGRVEGGDQ